MVTWVRLKIDWSPQLIAITALLTVIAVLEFLWSAIDGFIIRLKLYWRPLLVVITILLVVIVFLSSLWSSLGPFKLCY